MGSRWYGTSPLSLATPADKVGQLSGACPTGLSVRASRLSWRHRQCLRGIPYLSVSDARAEQSDCHSLRPDLPWSINPSRGDTEVSKVCNRGIKLHG
jgi:hypothetical protein